MRPMKRAPAGFTLLELMVVLAIAGLLFAVAIPAMGDFIRNGRITGAANDVMAALHFTRSEAIKRRAPVTLCTSTNAVLANGLQNDSATCANSPLITGWIAFVDTNQDGQRAVPAETLSRTHEPMNTLSTARAATSPAGAAFRVTDLVNGFAVNTNPTRIVLCDARGNEPSGGELSSARGIIRSVTGRAGVTRDMGEIQTLVTAIGTTVGGCSP